MIKLWNWLHAFRVTALNLLPTALGGIPAVADPFWYQFDLYLNLLVFT
ncbi:MAG: hypothetical protein GY697_00520 [Desulfobacterales bacterium]|nr:hypothetical protein [Desulfobacterales bacterium]